MENASLPKVMITSKLSRATRWQLVVAAALAVGALEYRFGLSDAKLAKTIVEKSGYWLTGAVVVLFGLVLVEALRPMWRGWAGVRDQVCVNWPGLVVGLLGAIFLQVHEPHDFKVLFDEHVLAATAYDMHMDREASYPSYAYFVNGRLYPLLPNLDKRPLLFPFLVSVAHDLTGYRPENSFVVNGLLGLVFLLLVYLVGAKMGGPRVGVLGQLLMVGLPLLAQNATGGGYDLLNVTVLCGLLLACWNYWRQPGAGGLDLMVVTGVLLANCRYESLLYLLVLPVLVLIKWWRERNATLTWMTAISPLLVMLPLLHNQVFMQGGGYYQTSADDFLNIKHVPDNAAHALYFLFSPSREINNSVVLSAMGVVALLLTLIGIGARLPAKMRERGPEVPLLLLVLAVLGYVFLVWNLFWGKWDEPVVERFSLPLQLAFTWCIMYMAAHFARGRKVPVALLAALGVWSVVSASTVSSLAFATHDSPSYLPFNFARDYVLKNADTSVLVVCRSTLMFTLYGRPSISEAQANRSPEKLMRARDLGLYKDVWVIQDVTINRRLNAWVETRECRLDRRLVLQPLTEFAYSPETHLRISRVVGFDPKRPAGTVILQGEKEIQTNPSRDTDWGTNLDAGVNGPKVLMTQRPEGEPAAIPTATEMPASLEDLDRMIMSELPQ
jgi:hypothetical protein